MPEDPQTISVSTVREGIAGEPAREQLALLIAWSASEPQRAGEVALVPPGTDATLGRGLGEEGGARLAFVRQRPGANEAAAPLGGLGMSRDQLRVRAGGAPSDGLAIERLGRRPVLRRGVEIDRCTLKPGDAIHVRGQLVLLCTLRPAVLPALRDFPRASCGAFGAPDAFGMLGESAPAWRVRERVAFAAAAGAHVLLLGESGTGKELAAGAIHQLSPRHAGPFVARNASTLPAGIIDAELFGNARNYPNAGMAERGGLIGDARGGTLFLDEIAELPPELQSHLLRVLDTRGEYQRLGESGTRRSEFVLVGATNRETSALKSDLLARFTLSVALPPLRDRLDDVPLLAGELLARAAARSPQIAARFLASVDGAVHARIDPSLVLHLLERSYPANVRELDAILWKAMGDSPGDTVLATAALTSAAAAPGTGEPPGADAIRACLAEQDGNMTRAAAALGLPNRFALYRLMKKLGMAASDE